LTSPPTKSSQLAADLVLVAEDLLTIEEAAARAGLSVPETMALLDNPEILQLVEVEGARSRLSGATGQAQAVQLRDRVIELLGAKLTPESPPRLLLDILNAVRHVAAQSEETQKGAGFSLVVNLTPQASPEVVAEASGQPSSMAFEGGTVTLPWMASAASGAST
jgi:hypothetical protein